MTSSLPSSRAGSRSSGSSRSCARSTDTGTWTLRCSRTPSSSAGLRVTDYRLELNSIGDRSCRPAYLERLRPWLAEHEHDLDEDTREQARRNPLRVLDNIAAKPSSVQEVLRSAPTIGDSLCAACREHFESVRSYLDAYGVGYELVPTLVRGLDYYTRTAWEFVGPEEGANSTISGGGRYDYLAEELGGPPTPGVGFGAGIERLLIAIERE